MRRGKRRWNSWVRIRTTATKRTTPGGPSAPSPPSEAAPGPDPQSVRGLGPGRLDDVDAELQQLRPIDRRRRARHQVLRLLGLGESYDLANSVLPAEEGGDAIEARSDAAVWWRAVAQRFEEEAKTRLGGFVVDAECAKHPGLDVAVVDSQ